MDTDFFSVRDDGKDAIYRSPFYFSTVWEDPTIEIDALTLNTFSGDKPKDILMVTSAGDTAIALLKREDVRINSITCIDKLEDQNELAKLKLLIVNMLSKSAKYILNECPDPDSLLKLLDRPETRHLLSSEYWSTRQEYIRSGLNNCGRYELLFKRVTSGKPCIDGSRIFDFEYFKIDSLRKIFGDESIGASVDASIEVGVNPQPEEPFVKHFQDVLKSYIYTHPTQNNFADKIFYGKYKTSTPLYLDEGRVDINKINFVTGDFVSFLKKSNDESYDMVQTSNITDWMDHDTFLELCKESYRVLKPEGSLVMRRLISFNILKDGIEGLFQSISSPYDSSRFYTEVLVGLKI